MKKQAPRKSLGQPRVRVSPKRDLLAVNSPPRSTVVEYQVVQTLEGIEAVAKTCASLKEADEWVKANRLEGSVHIKRKVIQ